ncbi:hypothetical protein [Paraburkholderia lacunae]|uniref:hypothetical protein n=1 Tax=Paraburkholderia lacunae TaxID=2211104 RepID=UPI0010590B72|nr:hypothetical protein [Paraburkholderia lacunae]
MKDNAANETTYPFVTIGSLTERGEIHRNAACVGDFIAYENGTRAQIVTGIGLPDRPGFRPIAVVGSLLDNGDVITDSPDRENHTVSFVPVRPHVPVHGSADALARHAGASPNGDFL